MRRAFNSPITHIIETWPLAGTYHMRWGRDVEGQLWVSVENHKGECEAFLPYKDYLDMETPSPDVIDN